MTYPGGQHSAGFYIGGAQNLIFLRDTGAFYNKDIDGTPSNLPLPTRVVNDTLIAFTCGLGKSQVTPAGWSNTINYASGEFDVWQRLATNDASDAFPIAETTSRNVIGQMASFGNNDPAPPVTLTTFQGGGLNQRSTGADTLWPLFAMTAGATPSDTFVIGFWFTELNAAVSGAPTIGNNTPLTLIDQIAYEQVAALVGTIWVGWGFRFDATSAAVSAVADITHAPAEDFRTEVTQYTRWRLT